MRDAYITLLQKCVTRTLDGATPERQKGADWPTDGAETMVGVERLHHFVRLLEKTLENDIPGDVCEAGVWRGGVSIVAAAMLRYTGRHLWVADSFKGLPQPDPRYPADADDRLWMQDQLAVPLDVVRRNFQRYGLLSERVHFLPGWFEETLPGPIRQLCLLRCDGDMYSSTMHTLGALEPLLSPQGIVIIDDYGWHGNGCQQAVDDYRSKCHIDAELKEGPNGSAWWQV